MDALSISRDSGYEETLESALQEIGASTAGEEIEPDQEFSGTAPIVKDWPQPTESL